VRIQHQSLVTVKQIPHWVPISHKDGGVGGSARPGSLLRLLSALVVMTVFVTWTAPGSRTQRQARADDRPWRPAQGTWQVSGRCVPRRLVRAEFPGQFPLLCSQPVPLLSWDSPHGELATPLLLLVNGRGRGPPGTGPAWLASHPMFCSQSFLECPETQSAAPWGRHWCHRLDLIAGQVSPSFQLGSRQAPSSSCCQSRPVCVCPRAGSQEPAAGNRRASQGRLFQPACVGMPPNWITPVPSCLSSLPPSPVTL
jgi:hypothetical protein